MATCKHCGRPLILKDGKCLRCGKGPNEQITPNDGGKNSASGLPPVRTFTINGVSFNMILVEGGTFWMGEQSVDPIKPNYDPYAVVDSMKQVAVDTFYIAETLLTVELCAALFPHACIQNENVSLWHKVRKENPLFTPIPATTLRNLNPYSEMASRTGEFFRIPTEEEWEFAARGGNKSRGFRFAGGDILEEVGWYDTNRPDYLKSIFPEALSCEHHTYFSLFYSPPPVKMKKPNELGIYDMSGLMDEPCSIHGVPSIKSIVFRGGNCRASAEYCRIASRNGYGSYFHYVNQFYNHSKCFPGIRLAMTPKYERAKQQ